MLEIYEVDKLKTHLRSGKPINTEDEVVSGKDTITCTPAAEVDE